MSRGKKLLINTVILGFGSVLPKSVTFLILPILTAALTKAEFGTYDLILTSMSFIIPIFSLLIEQAVFRFLIDADTEIEKKRIVTNSLIYVILSSILLFLLTILILNQFRTEFKILIGLFILINLYFNYAIQVCRGIGLLKQYSMSIVINSSLNLILIYILVKEVELGINGLLVALIISIFIATLYAFDSSKVIKLFSFKLYSLQYIKRLLIYSAPLLPNSLSWWIVNISDRWLITAFLGIEMTAIYAIANKIPSMFNLIYNNFNLAWQESASISSKDSDIKEYYTNIFNHLFNFLAGMLLILITSSPVIFQIFIHESYYMAYYQMPILFLAMFFNSLAAFYGGIYVAFKNTKNISYSSLIAAFINISINLMFISKLGLYAASFSTLISFLILALYRAIDIQKYVHIKYNFTKIIIILCLLSCVLVINYLNLFYFNILNFIIAVIFLVMLNWELLKKVFIRIIKS